MEILANWFHFLHKLATHTAIIGHTPKVDLDLLRFVQYERMPKSNFTPTHVLMHLLNYI